MDSRTGFSDSNEISGGSSGIYCVASTETLSKEVTPPDISALRRLSETLESVFESTDFDFYSDAKIITTDGREISVHRCLLSARSLFFKNVFSGSAVKERGGKFELKELAKDFDVRFESVVAVLGYIYTGKVKPLPEGVCVCVDEDCSHLACRPALVFMVEVLYVSFVFQISELVTLYEVKYLYYLVAFSSFPFISFCLFVFPSVRPITIPWLLFT